ncbi:class II aldolase/adducin family protein [Altererythrobacter aurantiacus]|uniref:Class II aldolase/adducin family protein n=1 Tax=Parapontixanthobacter aurantiacus TaxID=1463599 RepID=A0A844ZBM1_9SPHN|nr:class II aldolase/adducin family protein [Parapontixanthobacter aurantiacus]MXO84523.1 class II aldolase/adducin family protein [Parapontixanthobacter aurantiacus]
MATQIKPQVDCSKEEWEARQNLAACYRIFDHLGWSESIYNHISLKIPGEDDTFLINPFGLLYDEVTASNLVKIDVEGNNVGNSPYMVNKAGFTQHAHFHKHLGERANAICHVHTTATMAVCSHEDGLLPTNFYACSFQDRIGYHDFEGVTVRPEEGERLVENLGQHKVLMLRNHGPVVMGKTIQEMFLTMWSLQRACEIQVATLSQGKAQVVTQDVVDVHQRDLAQMSSQGGAGMFDFEAWKRRVDKIDDSWRN